MPDKKQTIETIRHSLAHLLAMAVLEKHPEVKLGIGPVIENGFYYDFDFSKIGHSPSPDCLPKLEQSIKRLVKQNLKFSREEITADKAKEIFKDQPFKLELIDELQKSKEPISIYKSGDFIDLCAGPHVESAKEIEPDALKLTKIAGAYWRGNEKNPMLVRIYGIAFNSKKELDDYLTLQKEIEKRDHRKIGEKLDLFSFHDVAPGAPFWHPKGMIIFKELEKYWRQIHDESGYQEISTPIMVKASLFEQSGHMKHYRENMFRVCATAQAGQAAAQAGQATAQAGQADKDDKDVCYLKPMNCPESTYVYRAKIRSYRDLPLRLSEIGRLHRNELSGALGGMFRVRQITMDDAHIFCRPDQIQNEIKNVLTLVKKFYKLFNLSPRFFLSTKPDEAMGDPELWAKAESSLEHALKTNKLKYEIKHKDGAFYGPKIDIQIKDALGRDWQLATIQLDFQQPENFNLEYIDKTGAKQRPVMIHRAVFGSFERFIGVLIEHFAGALPFWLSPIQVWVLPIGASHKKYAGQIAKELKAEKIRVELRAENETIGKKIREGELQKIPYLLIIGDKEIKSKSVAVRKYGKGDLGAVKFKKFVEQIKKEMDDKK